MPESSALRPLFLGGGGDAAPRPPPARTPMSVVRFCGRNAMRGFPMDNMPSFRLLRFRIDSRCGRVAGVLATSCHQARTKGLNPGWCGGSQREAFFVLLKTRHFLCRTVFADSDCAGSRTGSQPATNKQPG